MYGEGALGLGGKPALAVGLRGVTNNDGSWGRTQGGHKARPYSSDGTCTASTGEEKR